MASQRLRYAAFDGRLADFASTAPASFMPLVSEEWSDVFDWRGKGPMPAEERGKLAHLVQMAHARGRRVRFWATPDDGVAREAVWSELVSAGVDYINTDHLTGLHQWLVAHGAGPEQPAEAAGSTTSGAPGVGRVVAATQPSLGRQVAARTLGARVAGARRNARSTPSANAERVLAVPAAAAVGLPNGGRPR
jgi:hypothetical protein